MKVLLALQYWQGDKADAMDAARLIADLEPNKTKAVDFLFSSRFDCEHDRRTVDYVSRKFDVYTHKGRRRGTGWPAGCNDLWFDTISRVYELSKAKKMPRYDCVLTFEGDCAPLRPGWVETLWAEWKMAKVKVMGDLLPAPGEHINGNAFFSGDLDFLGRIATKVLGCAPSGGWDYLLAPLFKQAGWFHSPSMCSEWNRHSPFGPPELENALKSGLVFFHGIKNDSLVRAVRQKWLPDAPPLAPRKSS